MLTHSCSPFLIHKILKKPSVNRMEMNLWHVGSDQLGCVSSGHKYLSLEH